MPKLLSLTFMPLLTYATTIDSVVTSTAVVACLIIYAVAATSIIAVGTAVVGIIVAGCTAVAASWRIGRASGCYCDHLAVPSTDNKLDAKPKSSSSFPSCACEYQNKACYGTL